MHHDAHFLHRGAMAESVPRPKMYTPPLQLFRSVLSSSPPVGNDVSVQSGSPRSASRNSSSRIGAGGLAKSTTLAATFCATGSESEPTHAVSQSMRTTWSNCVVKNVGSCVSLLQ